MELYIDIIFLVSWGMDAFLLWASGQICGFSTKMWRILLGAFLEALFYCIWLCMFWGTGEKILSFVLLSIGLFISYYPKQCRSWIRLFCSAWLCSFLMGGGINLLFTMTQAQQFFGRGMVISKQYPWWLLIWAIIIAYLCLKLAGKWLERNIQRRKEFCVAVIYLQDKEVESYLLIDTGNELKEDGKGVPIVQISVLLPLFTKEEAVKILTGERSGLQALQYSSLGNPNDALWGIRAEKMVLSFGEKRVMHKNIFVGINFDDFSGAYEGLVPPCLLKEE